MTPTPVTPSDSSCAFGGYTGCLDGEFGLIAFTGSDMSSSVSSSASSDSDDSLKDGNVNDVNDPPSSSRLLQYTVVLQCMDVRLFTISVHLIAYPSLMPIALLRRIMSYW